MPKFDALELAVDQPSRMTIHHPTTGQPLRDAEGKEAWIDLLSLDSDKAGTYDRAVTQQRLSQRVRQAPTADQLEAEYIGKLARLTTGWHLLGLDGSLLDVPCNESNAAELYSSNRMRWLREQVETWLATRANFTKGSSKNS